MEDDLLLFFYFCYNSSLFIGISLIFKKEKFLLSLIYFGFLGQLIWIIDYFSFFIGFEFLGISSFLEELKTNFSYVVTMVSHFTTLFLFIYYGKKIKPNKKSIIYSMIYMVISFICAFTFIPLFYNINYYSFSSMILKTTNGFILFFPNFFYVLFCLVIPVYLLHGILYDYKNKKKVRTKTKE
jgi:hypothetical protein